MLTGRIIFGIGAESLNVPLMIFLIKWFKGKELAFSQGLLYSLMLLSSSLNAFLTPRISESVNVQHAIFVGLMVCIVSIVMTFVLIVMDKYWGIDLNEEAEEEI